MLNVSYWRMPRSLYAGCVMGRQELLLQIVLAKDANAEAVVMLCSGGEKELDERFLGWSCCGRELRLACKSGGGAVEKASIETSTGGRRT
jgi:hypothetical protein